VRDFHSRPQFARLDSLDALQAWADACVSDIDAVYRIGGCVYGSLAGELIEADREIHDDLAAGYDQWIELFRSGLDSMRDRGDLRPDADPRHLAVALVAAHQGGAMRLRPLLRGPTPTAQGPISTASRSAQILSSGIRWT
jgi:hypothetical protein